MNKKNKYLVIFLSGVLEQLLFTLYLLAVNKYLILASSVLMFIYFFIYLLLVKYCLEDDKSILMLLTYAISGAVGNYIAMVLHLIK